MSDDLISRKELRKAFKKSQFFTEVNLYYARQLIDNAPTVEFPEKITIKCDMEEDRQELLSALRNARVNAIVEEERLQGERAERALAIIDRLRTDGYINNKEQGTLRRAILLPERSQGLWTTVKGIEGTYYCSECDGDIDWKSRYCPWCGAKMKVDYE